MEKRILVIGATGLLGEPVARHLQQSGFMVRLLVRDIEMALKRFGDDFEIVKGDMNDAERLEKALDTCFGVHINLSGELEQSGVENISATASKLPSPALATAGPPPGFAPRARVAAAPLGITASGASRRAGPAPGGPR